MSMVCILMVWGEVVRGLVIIERMILSIQNDGEVVKRDPVASRLGKPLFVRTDTSQLIPHHILRNQQDDI